MSEREPDGASSSRRNAVRSPAREDEFSAARGHGASGRAGSAKPCPEPGSEPPKLLLLSAPDGPLDALTFALAELGPGPQVGVVLRRPSASPRLVLREAAQLRDRAPRARLLIHRRVDVALAAGAGVHLPERGVTPADARRLLGPHALVGVSRHDAKGLRESAGASYATLSPFAPVPDKGPPLLSTFATLAAEAPLPVMALGGIGTENATQALRAGAWGLALLRAANGSRALETLRILCTLLDIVPPRRDHEAS